MVVSEEGGTECRRVVSPQKMRRAVEEERREDGWDGMGGEP